jgi:trigger factor
MRDEMRRQLERRLESEKETALDNAIVMALIQATELELPPRLREQETARTMCRYEARLREQGVEEEQIPQVLQQAQENASGEVEYELRSSFILDRIASERKVLVTESEVRQELANMASRYNRSPSEMQEYMERNDLMSSMRSTLRERKTLAELRDVVKIVEAKTRTTSTRACSRSASSSSAPESTRTWPTS